MEKQQDFLRHFLQHQDDLRAFIGSLVRDRHACDDILQEVALVLWQKFGQYDRERSFGAWARGIAANKIMQSFEKDKRLPLPLSPDATQIIALSFEDDPKGHGEEQEALRRCIQKLPERSRDLVRMRYEESLKLKDIAARVSSTLDAVHKTLSRIRVVLRECVEKELEPGYSSESS
jgi:RNA polymerase sigma-70 factor, ECF subfamily